MRRELIIKFDGDKVFYGVGSFLPLSATNIPPNFHRFKPNVYWLLEVKIFNEEEGKLSVKILNYKSSEQLYLGQSFLHSNITKIVFNDINTMELISCTGQRHSSFQTNRGISSKPASLDPPTLTQFPLHFTKQEKLSRPTEVSPQKIFEEPVLITEKLSQKVQVPFVELKYYDGYVAFNYRPYKYLPEVEIRTNNDFIKAQFDCVSRYISNQIGKNDAEFTISLQITKDQFGVVKSFEVEDVASVEIQKINMNIIENVKLTHTLNFIIRQTSKVENALSLLTSDEFYKENLDEELHPSKKDAEHILERAFEFKKSKHFLQLKYLSGRHKANIFKLRFTIKPFAFLFLLEGSINDYFVLETYTENLATYIWVTTKDIDSVKLKFKEIEILITAFKESNRHKYILGKPDGFYRIIHDYKNELDGFTHWKANLDNIIK